MCRDEIYLNLILKLGDFFQTNFLVFTDIDAGSVKHDSILNIPIDHAISTGSWANRELHNVGFGGWGYVRPDEYAKHLDYVKEKVDEGKLWVATVSQIMVYQLQKHGFNPIPSYDTLNKKIIINWEAKDPDLGNKIEALFYKSVITVNVDLTEFKFSDSEIRVVQAGNEITDFKVENKLLSINCFPHKGALEINVEGLAIGIEPSLNLSGLVIYKNAYANTTVLKFNDGTDQDLSTSLFDASGRILNSKKWQTKNPLEIGPDLNPGFYLLKLAKKNKSKTIKIIIQ